MDTKEKLAKLVASLKKAGTRITPQRYAVIAFLLSTDCHPSAEEIYAGLLPQYPTLSLATVYKTLHLLKSEQEVLELEFSEMGNRYDGRKPWPHPHAICTRCRKIIDPPMLDTAAIIEEVSKETGFVITNHRLDFFGLCAECQKG
jgi:Fur family peroxide stress response transcriptional regulator